MNYKYRRLLQKNRWVINIPSNRYCMAVVFKMKTMLVGDVWLTCGKLFYLRVNICIARYLFTLRNRYFKHKKNVNGLHSLSVVK